MSVEFSVLCVAQKGREVSGDAFCVSHDPFFATIADAHGSKDHLDHVALVAQMVATGLSIGVSKDRSLQNAVRHFDVVQEAVQSNPDFSALSAVATCLQVQSSNISLVQAGDVRLYQFDPEAFEGSVKLTKDHNPDHPDEEVRLNPFYESGKFIAMNKGFHCGGFDLRRRRLHVRTPEGNGWSTYSTRVTRGFGNQEFQPAVTHKPQFIEIPFDPGKSHLYAFCSDGGNKFVKRVFRKLKEEGLCTEIPENLVQMAQTMIDENSAHPKHDVTIIFFRISP